MKHVMNHVVNHAKPGILYLQSNYTFAIPSISYYLTSFLAQFAYIWPHRYHFSLSHQLDKKLIQFSFSSFGSVVSCKHSSKSVLPTLNS